MALISIFIILVGLGLSACDPTVSYYNYEELKESVISVELINYDNPDVKAINSYFGNVLKKILPFDFDKMKILAVLEEGQLDEFLTDFSNTSCWNGWYHADSPSGKSLRLIYSNGDFEVVSYPPDVKEHNTTRFLGKYNANGEVVDFNFGLTECDDFVKLVEKYFAMAEFDE